MCSLAQRLRSNGFTEKQIKRIYNLLNYRRISAKSVICYECNNKATRFFIGVNEIEYAIEFETNYVLGVKK